MIFKMMMTAAFAVATLGAPAMAQTTGSGAMATEPHSGAMTNHGAMDSRTTATPMAHPMTPAQMASMRRCQAMTPARMARNAACKKMMRAHPDMMSHDAMAPHTM